MKLIELYSLSSGLKIGKQHLLEHFFPLPFTKYITLHASSGMGGKNYPLWPIVVELIKPHLDTRDIHIVQLGIKDEPAVPGCYHTMGKDTVGQASYLLRGSLCHACNDSVWAHRAGHLGIPIVELFGPTSVENHSPYQYDKEKTIFLTSHRWGRNPTFAAQENPMSITLIDPYEVARSILKLLDIPHTLTAKTINVGGAFNAHLLELIPNCVPAPDFNAHMQMAVRYDLLPNEQILVQVLQTGRKVNLLTKTPIDLNLIAATKQLFQSFNYEVDETTPLDYVTALKKLIPGAVFFTRETDVAKVAALRFRFFDMTVIQQVIDKTRADFEKACREYVNDPAFLLDSTLSSGRLEFRSNKYVLSNGKIYLSLAHEKADLPVGAAGSGSVKDEDVFWHDQNHWMVYST